MPTLSDSKLRRLDLGLLLVFQEVYRKGTAAAASERLHLSQPAISHSLKRLEDLLEEPLFVRGPEGMRPTPRASEIAPRVDALLTLASETIISHLQFEAASSARIFRISVSDFAASLLSTPLATSFSLSAPRATLSLGSVGGSSQVCHLLRTGGIDLAIGRFPELPADIVATSLFDDDYQVVAREGHPAMGKGLSLAVYLQCLHAMVSLAGDLTDAIDSELARMGRTRRVLFASGMFLSTFATVGTSDLIVTAPRRLIARFAASFGLVAYELPFPAPRFRIDLLRAGSSLNDRALDWLTGMIQQALGVESRLAMAGDGAV